MTVFGGLQSEVTVLYINELPSRFNTDDGIWRATILFGSRSGFEFCRFNTDDGIWRATISMKAIIQTLGAGVSIPMTVFGGLQFSRGHPLLAN